MSFASSLKDAVAAVFGWNREYLEGSTRASREWREKVDPWWSKRLNMPHLTPRWVLQYWGTEVCRNGFHNDIWVSSIENKLRLTAEDIVITDCRFINEVNAIKQAGGTTIRVQRGENPDWYEDAINFNKGEHGNMAWALSKNKLEKMNIHASEYSSVGLAYDHFITNNDTIDSLHSKVKSLINL
jgi:hypothetical protein